MKEVKFEDGNALIKRHVCAMCGSELVLCWGGAYGIDSYVVRCAQDASHEGFKEAPGLIQAYRRGAGLPVYVERAIEKKLLPKGEEISRLISLVKVSYPDADLDDPSAAVFVLDCLRLDLDPILREIVPATFESRKTGRKVVQPIITEDGWLSLAARSCPDKWEGPPQVNPITDPDLKQEICGDRDAWVWAATGRTKDMSPGETKTLYGFVKQREYERAKREGRPWTREDAYGMSPSFQARGRAVKNWVRKCFPEARKRMIAMTSEWMARAEGVEEALKLVDEYRALPEGERKPSRHDFKSFWDRVKGDLKISPQKAHQLLGVRRLEDYLDQGFTLDDAFEQLKGKLGQQKLL